MAQKNQPNSEEIAVSVGHRDISQIMSPGDSKNQSMSGFDEDYVDIVDYIVRCTHKIWEEGGIGLIYDHYRHNVVIHTSDGMTYGRDKVIADSIKTMAAFPDIRLYADDVIWSGNDRDGFHSSHRITWVGHNTGYSVYGPPTGRRVVRQGIAHCFVYENRIVEEWICRDELALIRQLGFDEIELAKKMAGREADSGANHNSYGEGEVTRLRGQTTPDPVPPQPDTMSDIEYFVRTAIHEIWNWRRFDKIEVYYAENFKGQASTNRSLFGCGDFKAYLLGLLAAFSDIAITVDHVCWIPDGAGYRVATRWFLQGTHDGPGVYGAPTGKRIHLWGISHQQIENKKIVREWTVFDEFALLKQIYAPHPSSSSDKAQSESATT